MARSFGYLGGRWFLTIVVAFLVACGGDGGASNPDGSRDGAADGPKGGRTSTGGQTTGGAGGRAGAGGPGGAGQGGMNQAGAGQGGANVAGANGGTASGGAPVGGEGGSPSSTGGAGGGLAGGVAGGASGQAGALGGRATGGAGGAGGSSSGCGQEGAPCMVGIKYGLCMAGVCSVCADVGDDQACKTAYGSGRLCIGGSCVAANCRTTSECPSGAVCKNNQCGSCTDVIDDGLCGAGHLCVSRQCTTGDCRNNAACSGGKLCQGNLCQACADPGDDAACAARYGAGSVCKAGTCGQGCRSPAACAAGQLCVGASCVGCAGAGADAACAAVYGPSSVCVAGACSTGACAADTSCGGGTLCAASSCSPCIDTTDDARCTTRYGAGQLCVAGSCRLADCRADGDCSTGKLCKSNSCGACVDVTDDGTCAARYGAGNICVGGQCKQGCRASSDCSAGKLCSASNVCASCADPADDAKCAAAYGSGMICAGGTCATGCRTDAACSAGSLCKGAACGACVDVTDDGACAARYGAGNICASGQCVPGCRNAQGCVGNESGNLCVNATCTPCTADATGDAACTTAYGLTSVCASGACVPGNCRNSADCVGPNAGFRCVGNQCTPCANDSGCQTDPTYGPATICHTANTNASGGKGQCVSSACPTARTACTANPGVDFCCAGTGGNSCVSGNCCVTGDCSFGQICTNHQCTQCNTVSDGNYFVDPVNGSDSSGVTGSTTCAWKTVTYALAALAGSTQAATINIKATGDVGTASGETMPLGVSTVLPNGGGTLRIVPANRTIRGAGTDVPTIKLNAGQTAFYLAAAGSHLSQLVIDSTDTTQANRGSFGIRVFQGSDATTSIDHLLVRNTAGAGIRVERSNTTQSTSGVLAIGPGVTVTAAGTAACGGLHVLGNGVANLTGGVGSEAIQLVNNNGYGVCVTERGQINVLGTASYPVASGALEGTVVLKGNTSGGISIAQCIGDGASYTPTNGGVVPPPAFTVGNCAANLAGIAGPPPVNAVTGAAIWTHPTGTANGIYILAGSRLKLRSSVVLANARAGVRIDNGPTYTTGANTYRVYDLSGIDLGKSGDVGGNVLQVPWGAGAPVNGGAGIQVNITAAQSQTLSAVGNTFQDDATSSVLLDCRTSTAAISRNYPITTCFTTSTKGISVCGNLTAGTSANKVDVASCTIP